MLDWFVENMSHVPFCVVDPTPPPDVINEAESHVIEVHAPVVQSEYKSQYFNTGAEYEESKVCLY